MRKQKLTDSMVSKLFVDKIELCRTRIATDNAEEYSIDRYGKLAIE